MQLLTREEIDQRFELERYYTNYFMRYYLYFDLKLNLITRVIFFDGDLIIKGNMDTAWATGMLLAEVILPASFDDEGNVDEEKFIEIVKSGNSPFIDGKNNRYYPQI